MNKIRKVKIVKISMNSLDWIRIILCPIAVMLVTAVFSPILIGQEQVAEFINPDGTDPYYPGYELLFGEPVAVSGDWLMVGCPLMNNWTGAVYVYRRNGTGRGRRGIEESRV